MADTILLRRQLNQGCLDDLNCIKMASICRNSKASCCNSGRIIKPENWWVGTINGYIPCFCSSRYSSSQTPIHPQDPMR